MINLGGLSTGLACALLFYLWVNDALRVDKFHKNETSLYQVMERRQQDNGLIVSDKTPGLLAESLTNEMNIFLDRLIITGEGCLSIANEGVYSSFFFQIQYLSYSKQITGCIILQIGSIKKGGPYPGLGASFRFEDSTFNSNINLIYKC